jgi:hypothetical protein
VTKVEEKHVNKDSLREPFLVPSQVVLDTLRIYAVKEHKRYEEYFYELIREGFRVKYGFYPEEEANGYQQETMDMKSKIEGTQPTEGKNEGKTKTFSLLNPIKNIGRRK